ncbi:MAG: hypothetical protein RAK23_04860 [Thermoplasmata archaeon]|mgnify:CR=1 FL=1|nr:hypothetical protein [Thermoplasmata archaeon]
MTKILVIITSGKNDIDKAMSGMAFAYNAKINKYLDDIRIIFFGPSEELIASDIPEVKEMLKKLNSTGMLMLACKSVSDRFNVTTKLTEMGIKIEYIGKIIVDHVKEGFVPMTF